MALDLFILADCGTADRVAANLTLLKWPGIVKFSHNKFLSLFLLGVHINVGVIFLMQAANRLGMRLLKLVLLFVHHFRFVKSG